MSKFKPGDLCEIVDSTCLVDKSAIGTPCTVARVLEIPALIQLLFGHLHRQYVVSLRDGSQAVHCENCLRRRKSPETQGCWREILKVTGWAPTLEPACTSPAPLNRPCPARMVTWRSRRWVEERSRH